MRTSAILFLSLFWSIPGYAGSESGGSNVGGSGNGAAYSAVITQWCQGSRAVLAQYRSQAQIADLSQGTGGTVRLLIAGLHEALKHLDQISGAQDRSLTYRAILRGTELADALADPSGPNTTDLEATRAFLYAYYGFIDTVSETIDLKGYIAQPFLSQDCQGCATPSADFEARYVAYATAQLDWFLLSFIDPQISTEVVPRYSQVALRKALEFLTLHVSEDLSQSLWAGRFACAIQDLSILNRSIAAHNAGNKGVYGDDRYAINLGVVQLKAIRKKIITGCSK